MMICINDNKAHVKILPSLFHFLCGISLSSNPFFFFAVLGIKHRASHMLSQNSTIELDPQPSCFLVYTQLLLQEQIFVVGGIKEDEGEMIKVGRLSYPTSPLRQLLSKQLYLVQMVRFYDSFKGFINCCFVSKTLCCQLPCNIFNEDAN